MTETVTKSKAKPPGKKADPLTPDEQKRRFAELCEELGTDIVPSYEPTCA